MEKLKFKYQILRDRLLFFTTIFGSAFWGLTKEYSQVAKIFLVIGIIYATVGIIKTFLLITKILKDLND